jgi:glycosyltransferase involved in cell wall biosynthesis
MRVVIVCHAASPDHRGSEPGQSWDWAWYLSQHHDVWLVNYPEFRSEIDRYLVSHPNDRLRIAWVQTSHWLDPWQPNRSSTGARFKIHYMMWLQQVQRVVANLVKREAIDIVHQVGLLTVSAPSKLWRLRTPFIWGPIGGGETAPAAFRGYYGKDWGRELRRRLRISLIGKSRSLRMTARNTCYLMAVNRETETMLARAGAEPERLALMMDAGVRPDNLISGARTAVKSVGLTLLWAGRLEARKALPVLLDALAGLTDSFSEQNAPPLPVQLLVAGQGPKRDVWEHHARMRGIGHCVKFLGMVAPALMAELYDQADVFIFTSLQDAFGSVVLEAMTHALPVIVLDHHGCAAVLPAQSAIKIPVSTPAETVAALTSTIEDIRRQPQQLWAWSARALAAAKEFQWPARAEAMTRIYEEVVRDAPQGRCTARNNLTAKTR